MNPEELKKSNRRALIGMIIALIIVIVIIVSIVVPVVLLTPSSNPAPVNTPSGKVYIK